MLCRSLPVPPLIFFFFKKVGGLWGGEGALPESVQEEEPPVGENTAKKREQLVRAEGK